MVGVDPTREGGRERERERLSHLNDMVVFYQLDLFNKSQWLNRLEL
jgi:hypothetical protein